MFQLIKRNYTFLIFGFGWSFYDFYDFFGGELGVLKGTLKLFATPNTLNFLLGTPPGKLIRNSNSTSKVCLPQHLASMSVSLLDSSINLSSRGDPT